ncbi:MAG: arginine--tRNA ligase, partial [Deferribacteraceae bacterium]|nr:arginine--tRNA ligase [Deferribacteraceae bacterium]
MKTALRQAITQAIREIFPETATTEVAFNIDASAKPEHGDYACNVAMQLTKTLKRNPREIAQAIADHIAHDKLIAKVAVAGPGFINISIKTETYQQWLGRLLAGEDMLRSNIGHGHKAMVEFVSANPTGPLHIGHGRGAAIGDSIAAILGAVGYNVSREYYVNDAGNQMNKLAKSIYARYCELKGKDYPFPEDGYKGDYIMDEAKSINAIFGDDLLKMSEKDALETCGYVGGKSILEQIDTTLRRFNVKMEKYLSETSLYEEDCVKNALAKLQELGAVYDKDGAIWLNTKAKGDEEDRVLRKSDGSFTYLMPDLAYHADKFNRGFQLLIDVWGADHHGYIKRMESGIDYMGYDSKALDVVLVQMVSLVRGGEKVSMSTRAGEFIPLDWLIEEVGVDAARYFYNMRSADSQFEFDIDLAKSRSNDNPVCYIQYTHARACSLLAKAKELGITIKRGENLDLLTLDEEKNIIRRMMEFTSLL